MAKRFQCLLLNTEDNPSKNKTEISLMTVGVGLGNTQKWNKSSLASMRLTSI
jgi:hypothetical protein